jgi:hypothetical protein
MRSASKPAANTSGLPGEVEKAMRNLILFPDGVKEKRRLMQAVQVKWSRDSNAPHTVYRLGVCSAAMCVVSFWSLREVIIDKYFHMELFPSLFSIEIHGFSRGGVPHVLPLTLEHVLQSFCTTKSRRSAHWKADRQTQTWTWTRYFPPAPGSRASARMDNI